jgi:hypothetical protein
MRDGKTMISWEPSGTLSAFKVRKKGSSKYVLYHLTYSGHYLDQPENVTFVSWDIYDDSSRVSVFYLPPGSVPRIEGSATLTPDGGMVCELDYEIIYENNIKNYIIYNLDFLGEVKGCASDLPSSVAYLQRFQKADFTSFVGYAITRLILSQVPFGKFDTHYLNQKYYMYFLKKLRKSIWKTFLPFFLDPKYEVKTTIFFSNKFTDRRMGNCPLTYFLLPNPKVTKIVVPPPSPYTYEYKVEADDNGRSGSIRACPYNYRLKTFNFTILTSSIAEGKVVLLFIFKNTEGENWLAIAEGTVKKTDLTIYSISTTKRTTESSSTTFQRRKGFKFKFPTGTKVDSSTSTYTFFRTTTTT